MRTAPQEWVADHARLVESAPREEDLQALTDAERIDLIAALERGKGALSALQAGVAWSLPKSPTRLSVGPPAVLGAKLMTLLVSSKSCTWLPALLIWTWLGLRDTVRLVDRDTVPS